jgi:hypothetical protein
VDLRHKFRHHHFVFTLQLFVLWAFVSSAGWASPGSSDAPMRDLWSRGNHRFIRDWMLLGPFESRAGRVAGEEANSPLTNDFLASFGGESSITPSSNPIIESSDGSKNTWSPFASYQDTVDLPTALGIMPYRGHDAVPQVEYAYHSVERFEDGDAVLSIGSSSPFVLWVNGQQVYKEDAACMFAFDRESVKLHLRKGANALLFKFEHVTGPWQFAVRVREPGELVAPISEIAPSIVKSGPGELVARTHYDPVPHSANVVVEVVAAGGKTLARSDAVRGSTVRFASRSWPDGAYEIRFVTRTAWGRMFAVHLPWYKGNPLVEVRQLLDIASHAPNDVQGSHLRLLADLVRERLGNTLASAPDDTWMAVHSELLEFEELELGREGPVHPWGFVRLAYLDPADGSTQFCRAYLPAGYDPLRHWPMIVSLHGFNPPNPPYTGSWSVDERHNSIADRHGTIVLEPYGRGNAQYQGIGEEDVLRCISEAKKRFSVDANRVYLTGDSMGGSGTWIIASRHPDIFAAAAPVFGGWDYRVAPGFGFSIPARSDYALPELFSHEVQSSFLGAEGLLNVPLFVHHGDDDHAAPIAYSRFAVRMLQRWGYDIRYQELPGWGHEDLDDQDQITDWLLSHTRSSAPRHVRIRSADLPGAAAYWVHAEQWEEPLHVMQIDAEVIMPGVIRLDTVNVAKITLTPPASLMSDGDQVRVVWNGVDRIGNLSSGRLTLSEHEEPAASLNKTPILEGRLSSLISTPFVVVVGTSSPDPVMRRFCQEKADTFADLWHTWQHERPRVFKDSEITRQEEEEYSLLLIGGPGANLVAQQIASRIPLSVAPNGFTIDGRKFPASDAVIQMIYPSPYHSDRYVTVVESTSTAGMYFWNPSVWNQPFGFPDMFWDWNIRDGRSVALEEGFGPERGWVAAGVYDRHWRLDDRWVFLGSNALRDQAPIRLAPLHPIAIDPAVVNACIGNYQLAPGVTLALSKGASGSLNASFNSGPAIPLIAESRNEFATPDSATTFEFNRNTQGVITSVQINTDGQEMSAPKLL